MFHNWRAVQWWDEWQLRILVLGSLLLQWFLLIAAPMRRYIIPRVFRASIGLAYIGSNALAIYALGTLFHRHVKAIAATSDASKKQQQERALELLWAPILLIHLGGQEELAVISVEDNKQWVGDTVTLVSKAAVALYVFYESWPSSSDRRLLASAILLFIIGLASFAEKPWAVSRAGMNRMASMSAKMQGKKETSKWFRDEDGVNKQVVLSDVDKLYMILSDLSLLAAADDLQQRGMARKEDVLRSLSMSARKSMRLWLRGAFGLIYTRANVVVHPAYLTYHVLVAPVLHLAALALFAAGDKHGYSRADVKTTYVLMCFTAALDVLSVFIRQLLYRAMSNYPALCETVPGYNLIDAAVRRAHGGVGSLLRCAVHRGCREEDFACNAAKKYATYDTLSTTVIGDLAGARGRDFASYRFFYRPPNRNNQAGGGDGTGEIEVQMMMAIPDAMAEPSFTTDNDRHRRPPSMPCPSYYLDDADAYTAPAPASRNWALSEELQEMCGLEIRRSLRGSFDRSVVIWHVATDLCFRTDPRNPRVNLLSNDNARRNNAASSTGGHPSPPWCCPPFLQVGTRRNGNNNMSLGSSDDEVLHHRMYCAASISDYMAHLLNSHPDMLLTGSRQHLVTEAIREMENILYKQEDSNSTGRQPSAEVLNRIIEVYSSRVALPAGAGAGAAAGEAAAHEVPLFHIPKACRLAKELKEIENPEVRWHLLYRVWLGMLCYSASMCKGYLHAKSLGEGGEFLSYLWLFLSLSGAKTLADKLQMPELL